MGGSGNVSHPGIFHPDTPGTCFPVCRAPYTGGESDGWGWYANYRSCVVLGSVPHQASTGACSWGRVSRGSCYALCTSPSVDPDNDGWGYENSASCIVSGSPADTSVDCVE